MTQDPMRDAATAAESDLAEFGYKQELRRTLSTRDLLICGLVFMVPIAPWAIFGVVFNEAKGMVPLVYLIGPGGDDLHRFVVCPDVEGLSLWPGRCAPTSVAGCTPTWGSSPGGRSSWTTSWPTLLYVFAAESMYGIFPGVPKFLWIVVFLARARCRFRCRVTLPRRTFAV